MERSVENLRKTLVEAKLDIEASEKTGNPFELMKEWDAKLDEVNPWVPGMSEEEQEPIFDMLFEWNVFCIGVRRRAFEAEERRVG